MDLCFINNNKLIVKCNNDIKDYYIVGTSVLELSKDCMGYSKTFQFILSTTSSFMYKNYVVIDFDITQDDCCNREVIKKSIPLLSNVDLDSLKEVRLTN